MATGSNFKAEDNLVAQTLLHLSASGSSIVSEILRLAQNIPDVLLEKESEQKFEPVLFGFEYLENSEEHERRINMTTGLLDLDQVFMDSYGAILVSLRHYFSLVVCCCRTHSLYPSFSYRNYRRPALPASFLQVVRVHCALFR